MSDRKRFEWTDADRAKLVPGARVVIHWIDAPACLETVSNVDSHVHTVGDYFATFDICDPTTIEPPCREESGLVAKLRELADELRTTGTNQSFADRLESILKEHGHAG